MLLSFFEWIKKEGYRLPPPPPPKKKKLPPPPAMKKPVQSSEYKPADIKGQEKRFGSRNPFGG